MRRAHELCDYLRKLPHVLIQAHNFPDHDAVASAFALRHLLREQGIASTIVYEGDIQRDSLRRMIRELHIDVCQAGQVGIDAESKIVIVDGCKGNQNVTDLPGDEVAVIDHHEVRAPEDVPFRDIRPECGACASILWSYYHDLDVTVPRDVATALMIGINMDTSLLTRGVSETDIRAFAALFPVADIPLQNSILRNYIQTKDLDFYRHAIENVRIEHGAAFCFFPEGCDQNLLGILSDFFMALREVDFVVLCAHNRDVINFSLRSERAEWDASRIVQDALRGIGFGGGHANMAGGMIRDATLFDVETVRQRFSQRL